jgi:tetratricopeptide (TPR) repeat protein
MMASPAVSVYGPRRLSGASDTFPMSVVLAEIVSLSAADVEYLSNGIIIALEALQDADGDSSIPADFYENLGLLYKRRYRQNDDLHDLQAAIMWAEHAVAATPPDGPDRARRLNDLGNMIEMKFGRTGKVNDLDLAIKRVQQAVTATPPNHPHCATFLANLGNALGRRFERTRDLSHLERAIQRLEEAVAATPLHHPDRADRLANLGTWVKSRFDRTGAFSDLQLAIKWSSEALVATPPDHPRRSSYFNSLGSMLVFRFKQTGNECDYEQAFRYFKRSLENTTSSPTERLRAAFLAICFLSKNNNLDVYISEVTEAAVNLLPRISPRLMGRTDQQHLLLQYSRLAILASCAAIRVGKSPSHALQLFESGHGVMANQQFEIRGCLADRRQNHPEEEEEFERLRDELDSVSDCLPALN